VKQTNEPARRLDLTSAAPALFFFGFFSHDKKS